MKSPCVFARLAVIGLAGICGSSPAATIDGSATGEEGYTTRSVQTLASTWGSRNALANLRSVQEGNTLNIFMGGVTGAREGPGSGESILLFIDSKPGGISRIGPEQIQYLDPEGEDFANEYYINQLAVNEDAGLTFESGFQPDHAIRIGGTGTGTDRRAYVNRYDLVAGTFEVCGEAHQANLSNGFISDMRVEWNGIGALQDYAAFPYGVEMALSLPGLGATGAETVKVMALLVDGIAYTGSNQVLGSLPEGSEEFGELINQADFENIAGNQTISIPLAGNNTDSDGDGLPDSVETGTGIYVDANNTGSSPTNADTDGDGYPDGAEVNGSSALGHVSNPNIPNYLNMSVPGSFNLPVAWQANGSVNTPVTSMTRASTSLAGQYQWTLDYKFPVPPAGNIFYKFTTGNSFAIQWGAGAAADSVVPNGTDIPATVSASGIHRFSFDQAAMTRSFSRVAFPTVQAFLAAYGVSAGTDTDGDGIANEAEFTLNTDPTNPDTDGDGLDDTEPDPLVFTSTQTPYSIWIASYPGADPSPTADSDRDGFNNLKEFYFGTSPVTGQGNLVAMERSGGSLVLRWLQVNSGVNYQLQESTTLPGGTWLSSGIIPVTDPDQSGVASGFTRKLATVTTGSGKLFLRVVAAE